MKVIVSSEEAKRREEETKEIKKKNLICPCCGEEHSQYYYETRYIWNKGTYETCGSRYKKCLFKNYSLVYKIYRCNTCGAKWEGDPFKLYKND